MAMKAINMKWDEFEISDMKRVAAVFNMTLTDLVKDACREYVGRLKADPFYKLTVNVEEASVEEAQEILEEIEGLTDDDLNISSSKKFTV